MHSWTIFIQSEFSNAFSNYPIKQIQSSNGCILTIFLQNEFPNVFSNRLPEHMHSRIGCICTTFLQCVKFQMWSYCLPKQMHSCTGFPCMICFCSEISNVSSNFLLKQMQSRIGCIIMIFSRVGFKSVLKLPARTDSYSHWLHLNIFFQREFSTVPSKHLPQQMQSRIGYICLIFLRCEFLNASSESTYAQLNYYIDCILLAWSN